MMDASKQRIVVIGAGHAGGTVVALLRRLGHKGSLTMFGDETHPPYQRPPLSKEFGDGVVPDFLRPVEFYSENDIELALGDPVIGIDRAAKTVSTGSGKVVGFDTLIIATGAAPRMPDIPGIDFTGVTALRTLEDAQQLAGWQSHGRRVLVLGGGYIGLEVAAVLRARGNEVTVLEREHRVLTRVASAEFAEVVAGQHKQRGTRIMTGADVSGLEGANGKVTRVRFADGTYTECDAVLVGVGAKPNDRLAWEADLQCAEQGGVVVDAQCRTNDPSIYAIGDVTVRPVPGSVFRRRLESIPSAIEQARQAAAFILGKEVPEGEVPWFWSDQFDLKLKIAGFLEEGAEVITRGDADSGRFALFHLVDDKVVAVESSNSAPSFMAGKRWISGRDVIPADALRDESTPLKAIVTTKSR